MTEKPHHGRIKSWRKSSCHGGYLIEGEFLDHPFLRGKGHTSLIVAFDENTKEVETRNSRYRLVEDGEPTRMHGWPWKGDRMRFLGRNGYDYELEAASKAFNTIDLYEVKDIDVGDWRSTIAFVGIDGRWNSVMFESAAPSASLTGKHETTHPTTNQGD